VRIYRYVHRRLTDHEAAEDITAEIFFKALRAIDSYNPRAAPPSLSNQRHSLTTRGGHTAYVPDAVTHDSSTAVPAAITSRTVTDPV
jgi:hypothetical protein